ncbi:MAG: putative selenate reductase subunit YgfK [Saprospiraceae bacterium]|nr:putative selenate reductase subunit YgfK [Saprospiraceae bacterium]
MSDKFEPVELKLILDIILKEYRKNNSIFGIPSELFYNPEKNSHLRTRVFDQVIDNPIGVAAGPHTQLAQNIAAAWLMGARYIELKTIQTLDELEIAKPCIDMQDEGYNCEWSQELKINESFHEYLNAWILIHVLHHLLGFKTDINTVFNMSVGYNMEGILKPNVQWFFEKMNDCSEEMEQKIKEIKHVYPEIENINIPVKISDNITLSTMHGCPANEIEEIASYLLKNKKLHTFVKLNPTLIGKELLREIVNGKLKFKTQIPDVAFEHDLKYKDALNIIRSLQSIAHDSGLQFGLKLTNTLESVNIKSVFDPEVEMMYMSGRALHPVSINLANKLQNDLVGEIPFSFSAGVDAFNVSEILSCGFKTITVCSDLLKPGGYMRLYQYFEELQKSFSIAKANSIKEYIIANAKDENETAASLKNLSEYSQQVLDSPVYKQDYIIAPDVKTRRSLSYFDCISAPCTDTCSTHQDIPEYLYYTSIGDYDNAFKAILKTNPFPSITGLVCDHLCQNKCTRINYDDPVLIREVKRFISDKDEVKIHAADKNGIKVAVIGAGLSGLSCAYFLAFAGFSVDVFEEHSMAGGMVQYAIPGFRLSDEAIAKDFKRVTDLGVNIFYSHKIDKPGFNLIREKYHFIYISIGAQKSLKLDIEGNESDGVIEPLDFLFKAKKGEYKNIGRNIVIIGGGNTAMDAARTAFRLSGINSKITIIYRRTISEMPADQGEIKAVIEEGMEIIELVAPIKIVSENGKVKSLLCVKMKLGKKDATGRPRPEVIPGSEFEIPCDVIIPAIGQKIDMDFISFDLPKSGQMNYETGIENIYIGGDSLRGASTAINAIGDGRKVAELIMNKTGLSENQNSIINKSKNIHSVKELMIRRSKRIPGVKLLESPVNNRRNFEPVSFTLDEKTIREEADRCLYCDEICNICTTVCPNFANYSYDIEHVKIQLQIIIKNEFGHYEIADDLPFIINQRHQIINIANFCNECGNCTTFCPTNSAPYLEKPKIHLTKESYDKNHEGYYFDRIDNKNTLYYKNISDFHKLLIIDNKYIYESNDCYCEFRTGDFSILKFKAKDKNMLEFNFRKAAEMRVIFKGLEQLV